MTPHKKLPTVYEARAAGREFCQTEGADHYRGDGPEPLDLVISRGYAEGFCLGGAIKYAGRYSQTRDLQDLKKAVDMLHIYCGVELLGKEVRRDCRSERANSPHGCLCHDRKDWKAEVTT